MSQLTNVNVTVKAKTDTTDFPFNHFIFHLQVVHSLKKFHANVSPMGSKDLTIHFPFCVGHANCFHFHSHK